MVAAAHKYSTAEESEKQNRIENRKKSVKTVTNMFGKGRISYSLLFHASKISEWHDSISSVKEESKTGTALQEKEDDAITTI